MVKNLNILFYLRRDKADNKGMVPIYCRISVDGKRSELSLKRYVDPTKWISGKERVSGTKEEAKSINAHIESVRLNIYNHIRDLEHLNEPITAQSIKNAYLGMGEKSVSLIDVFTDHNEKVKSLVGKDFAHGTLDR